MTWSPAGPKSRPCQHLQPRRSFRGLGRGEQSFGSVWQRLVMTTRKSTSPPLEPPPRSRAAVWLRGDGGACLYQVSPGLRQRRPVRRLSRSLRGVTVSLYAQAASQTEGQDNRSTVRAGHSAVPEADVLTMEAAPVRAAFLVDPERLDGREALRKGTVMHENALLSASASPPARAGQSQVPASAPPCLRCRWPGRRHGGTGAIRH